MTQPGCQHQAYNLVEKIMPVVCRSGSLQRNVRRDFSRLHRASLSARVNREVFRHARL